MQEQYFFSVLATILGMAVVFSSLVAMSLMMKALRALLDREKRAPAAAPAAVAAAGLPDWVWIAAAVALALEGGTAAPAASLWQSNRREENDPWIMSARSAKKGFGF